MREEAMFVALGVTVHFCRNSRCPVKFGDWSATGLRLVFGDATNINNKYQTKIAPSAPLRIRRTARCPEVLRPPAAGTGSGCGAHRRRSRGRPSMKKLINRPADYVDEMLDGLTLAHPTLVRDGAGGRVVRRAAPAARGPDGRGKVGLVSGGGSGHLPLFTGYVGPGLLDACAVGNVFEGPNVASCLDAIRLADAGRGVVRLYGNYGGDRMNFDMAGEMLEDEGIATTTVLGTDDVASGAPDAIGRRRGVAGIVYAYKAAGAAAEAGADLAEVTRIAAKAVAATRTIGVALAPCRLPAAAAPSFALGDDEIEMGMGIHGEPGIWRDRLRPADAVADEMLDRLLADLPPAPSGRLSLLVNGLGATPLEELFIVHRHVARRLGRDGLTIVAPMVGNYVTAMEMVGLSLSLHHLDDELERLLLAPAACPFWRVA
jgi:dihydroxyacetone kinase-like protein